MGLEVKIKKLNHFKGDLPAYQTTGSSGVDVRAQLDEQVTVQPGERVLIPTGLAFEIPIGFEIQARPRSGLALKKGLTVLNSPGTIDADYRGEVKIILINHGQDVISIEDQERIAQLVVTPVVQPLWTIADELGASDRGVGGFGSTGI